MSVLEKNQSPAEECIQCIYIGTVKVYCTDSTRHCPKLVELSLKGSGKVGDESVGDLATCSKLRVLDIQVCQCHDCNHQRCNVNSILLYHHQSTRGGQRRKVRLSVLLPSPTDSNIHTKDAKTLFVNAFLCVIVEAEDADVKSSKQGLEWRASL